MNIDQAQNTSPIEAVITYRRQTFVEETLAWAEDLENKEPEDTLYIVHTGTNNLKRGMTADMLIETLKLITEKLDKNNHQYLVSQLPPAETSSHLLRQTTKYNIILENTVPEERLLKIADSDLIDENDKLHLSKMGAAKQTQEYYKQLIKLEIIEADEDDLVKEVTLEHTVSPREAAIIIGKQGGRVRALKDKHGVNIDRTNTEDRTIFKITGFPQNASGALNEIKTILENTEIDLTRPARYEVTTRYSQQLCRNYERNGECRFGNDCSFRHGQRDHRVRQERDRSPIRRPHEESYNHRSDSRQERRYEDRYNRQERRYNRYDERTDERPSNHREAEKNETNEDMIRRIFRQEFAKKN